MSWHYIKNITKKPRVLFPKGVMGNNTQLADFTNNTEERKGGVITGRAWKVAELRLKSRSPRISSFLGNYDLHRLWYVLLKEKNRLYGDRLLALQMNQQFNVHNNMKEVRLSMRRLKSVVGERKQIRDKYRRYLEDQYIQQRKNEELEQEFKRVLFPQ